MNSDSDEPESKESSGSAEIKEPEKINNGNHQSSHEVSGGIKQQTLERKLPRVNCEERIVFVVDLCSEENSTLFHLSEGSTYSFLYLVKRALSLYLYNKKAINPLHKFSLVVLQDSPIWTVDFTSNPKDIINELETVVEIPPASNFDLTQLFDLIKSQITLPSELTNIAVVPPPYIVRTILMYGRSQCLPQFLNGKSSFTELVENPYFFLDVLYVHEAPSDDTKCEGIFDLLCDLDTTGWSYIFEVGRNATRFHNLCSILLAHPLQRPSQKDAHHTLGMKEATN